MLRRNRYTGCRRVRRQDKSKASEPMTKAPGWDYSTVTDFARLRGWSTS